MEKIDFEAERFITVAFHTREGAMQGPVGGCGQVWGEELHTWLVSFFQGQPQAFIVAYIIKFTLLGPTLGPFATWPH